MSYNSLITNITYHKEQLKSYRIKLLGIFNGLQNNEHFSEYVHSLKNIIYNLNYLNIIENVNLETINHRIDFHHKDIEIYSCLNKLRNYKCKDNNLVLTKLLYRNSDKLYNWYYELHFLTSNHIVKQFLERTNIGLPLEINKIISGFLPNYKTIDLTFNIRLDKTTFNTYQHKKKFLWQLNEIETNIHNNEDLKLKIYKNLIKIELIKYSYSINYVKNKQNKEIKLLNYIKDQTQIYLNS
tara:strand:- start:318 stop:1037 length:720 start_codon:yes stop_codon:yes gene_type:complete